LAKSIYAKLPLKGKKRKTVGSFSGGDQRRKKKIGERRRNTYRTWLGTQEIRGKLRGCKCGKSKRKKKKKIFGNRREKQDRMYWFALSREGERINKFRGRKKKINDSKVNPRGRIPRWARLLGDN